MQEATALRKIVENGRFLGYGVPGEFLIRPRRGVQVVEDWPWRPKSKPALVRKAEIDILGYIYCARCGIHRKMAPEGRTAIKEDTFKCPSCATEFLAHREETRPGSQISYM